MSSEATRRVQTETSSAIGASIVIKVIRFAFALATSIYIRRTLGPELVGHYSITQFAMEIGGAVASLGMGHVILRFLPDARLGPAGGAMKRILGVSATSATIGWGLVLALVVAAKPFLVPVVKGENVYALVLLAIGLLAARISFDIVLQVHHALLDLRRVPLIMLVWQVLFLAGLVFAVSSGWGVAGVLVAAAVANVVGSAALALLLRGRLTARGEREAEDYPVSRLLRFGLPFAAINLLYNVVWRHSETLFLNYHWSAEEAGQFFVAYSLPQQILEFVPAAIWPLVLASFAAVFAVDRDRAVSMVGDYYKLLFLLVVPLAVGGVVLGDRALVVLNGEAYQTGASLARWFFAVQFVGFLGAPLSMMFYVLEKPMKNLAVWAGAAVINVGLNAWLVPIDWRLGAVLPVSVAVCLMPLALSALLRREGISVAVPWGFLLRVVGASLLLLLFLPVRDRVDDPLTLIGAAAAASLLVVVGFRLVPVFRPDDASMLDFLPDAWRRRTPAWLGGTR